MEAKPAVLVTRPAGQAAGLCSALEQLGYDAFSHPMLELVALERPDEPQQRHISGLDRYQHIIFISGNAVHFGMAWIGPSWPSLPAGPRWHAIGDSTARQLRKYGVQAVNSPAGMSTESLLADPALQDVGGQRVLIVKGRGGRVRLRAELLARGAGVDELPCYLRQCPEMAPGALAKRLADWRIGLILISSGEGLGNMLTLLSPQESSKLMAVPIIVPSGRVAEMATDRGFATVHTAANASDAAVLRAVENWWRNGSGTGE
jgi:uroporphyrinogen-III synthase